MRARNQRMLVGLAVTLIGAVGGVAVGDLLGRAITLRQAERRLDEYASRILTEGEASTGESRTLLATMNASPYAFCSDAEIAYFRKLIFQSQYLKEGGRMRGGRIECSTVLGRVAEQARAEEPLMPDVARQDGTRIFRNLAPFRIDGQTVIAVQLGESFIVYSPYNLKSLAAPPMRFTVTEVDAASGRIDLLLGQLPAASREIFTREGVARQGDTLYASRCSQRFMSCMTAYMTVGDALRAERSHHEAYMLLMGLGGAGFGLLCSLVYQINRSLERQLRRAVENRRLSVVYQPIVELASGKMEGAEMLARWTDEDGAAVSPDVFIRMAEERGFVGEITRIVLDCALADFAEVIRRRPEFSISMNVTATDLADDRFLPMVEGALARAGIAARNLTMEITESSTARQAKAMETIYRLRAAGHQVHIDDFGTGFSSLSYLHDLAVDAIKIDKSFTQAIGTGAVTVGILPQILAMAEALGLEVVVEGIETQEQADYFASYPYPHAILAQGWLFGRPVPAGALAAMLRENEGVAATQSSAGPG